MRPKFFGGSQSLWSLSGSFSGRVSTNVRASTVAVLTIVDVGARTLPALLTRLLDTDLVPVVVSLLLGALTTSGLLPTVAPLLLYGYLVYTLTPRLFPDRLRYVTEQRGFRLIKTSNVLFVPLLAFAGGPEWDRFLILSGLVILPAYLVVVQRRDIIGVDGYPVALANAFFPSSDLQEGFEDDPHVRNRTLRFWLVIIAFVFMSVILSWLLFLVVGVLLLFLSLSYPVPELLLAGWVGQRALLRGPVGPDEEVLERYHLDLETRVLSIASAALEGVKGFSSVVMAGAGFGLSVVLLYVSIFNVETFVDLAIQTPTFSPARLLIVVVGTLTVCGFGLYGVWYWVRMMTRVPPFLAAWRARLCAQVETDPEREASFLPTRPPGYFLPPFLMVWVVPAMDFGSWEAPRLPPAWTVLAWLAVFVLTVWTAYQALVADPQPAHTDQRALPGSFLIVTVGWWLFSDLTTEGEYDLGSSYIVGLVSGRVSVDQFLAVFAESGTTIALVLVTVPLYGFWYEDVFDWHRRDDWVGYAYVPYLLVAVLALGTLAALTTGIWPRVFFGISAAAIFGLTTSKLLTDFDVVDWEW